MTIATSSRIARAHEAGRQQRELTGGLRPRPMPPAIVLLALVAMAMAGLLFAPSRPANGRARCFWSASPRCLPGRSAALSAQPAAGLHLRSLAGGAAAVTMGAAMIAMKRDFAMRPRRGIVAAPVSAEARGDRGGSTQPIAERRRNCRDQCEHLIRTPSSPPICCSCSAPAKMSACASAKLVRLWREGFFRWSIVSGGVTPGSSFRNARSSRPRW